MKDAKNHNIKVGYVYIYKNKTPFQIHFSEFIIRKLVGGINLMHI